MCTDPPQPPLTSIRALFFILSFLHFFSYLPHDVLCIASAGMMLSILLFFCLPLLKYSTRWTWLSSCPAGSWSHHTGMSQTSMPTSFNVDVRSLETEYS